MLNNIKIFKKRIDNSFLLQVITCFLLCIIIIIFFLIFNKRISIKKSREYTIINDIKLMNSIDKLEIEDDILKLEGYAFLLEQDSNNNSILMFLKNLKDNNDIWMDVETTIRPDIQDKFYSEYNYETSGFIATTKYKNLEMDDGYEIFVKIDINDNNGKKYRKTVSTNRYIYKDKLYQYNPYEFDFPINAKSELLNNIFKEGNLQFYRKDAGVYVYEYKDKLYWIASKNFKFNENGQTQIPFHIYTTQINMLPEDRVQYKYDNYDFFFEEFEIKNENTEPYRVAVHDLPKNYPITYIHTGTYDNKNNNWIWDEYFQLKR